MAGLRVLPIPESAAAPDESAAPEPSVQASSGESTSMADHSQSAGSEGAPFTEVSPRPSGKSLDRTQEQSKDVADARRSCRGCLLFSRSILEAGGDPVCIGFARSEPGRVASRAHAGDKDVRPLTEFKYACVGYSIYRKQLQQQQQQQEQSAPSSSSSPPPSPSSAHPSPSPPHHTVDGTHYPMDTSQLPLCTGLEVLALADTKAGDHPHAAIRAPSSSSDASGEATEPASGSRGPASAPPPLRTPLGTVMASDFPAKFMRSAGLIANKCASNLRRAAEAVKAQVADVFQSGRDRSK